MTSPVVVGVSAEEQLPDAEEVLRRAILRFDHYADLQRRKANQSIRFDHYPVGIAFVADNHIGAEGTDYRRMFAEAELMASTPNLYVVQVGDLVDNMIIGKLQRERMGTSITIPEEWALAKRYLELLGPKLLAVVGGNHDAWTQAMAGFDQLRQVLTTIRRGVLYDKNELSFEVVAGGAKWPLRLRHNWGYRSLLNPTHGIERAFERDQTRPFLLGVGAHTHVSGLVRQFNAGGRTGLAVQCGTYKCIDSYAQMLGAATPNGSTAIVVIFHPEHGMNGYDNLQAAVERLKG